MSFSPCPNLAALGSLYKWRRALSLPPPLASADVISKSLYGPLDAPPGRGTKFLGSGYQWLDGCGALTRCAQFVEYFSVGFQEGLEFFSDAAFGFMGGQPHQASTLASRILDGNLRHIITIPSPVLDRE